MKEKQNEDQTQEQEAKNELEHTLGIMATWFKAKLPAGARLSDLVQKLKEEATERGLHDFNIHEYLMRLNDVDVEFDQNGKLKEDPVLTESSVLSLVVKKLTGGN
ncbi:hypothetical protein A3A20_02180 [Candidatus Wolfebacteria bacterium RIFCSPLOWO2_01_FULL_45_19]|uniref:Uncharacterized protein n=1 Tax=Candidatus Wolfebacteria bacterium RIFCSPLOWO2_01_FULL_45_19 TaxID=1802557 RepID=A0A1F8DSX2_9BACT|nr:MAG: hypothetical protein UX23_C0001G0074 [Parcubacteria group bacterium GW2011_GWB1_45_9]OGM91720.1 MAG: hypothetical protein A3A20_02180 [Candidatus Wolfebacteria bacterium RIFCSPLOWO2_01_FULL_45_19]